MEDASAQVVHSLSVGSVREKEFDEGQVLVFSTERSVKRRTTFFVASVDVKTHLEEE